MPIPDKFELISEMAKRRGYFWPSYEIYGGVGGFYTFGPLGSKVKRKIEDKFRHFFTHQLNIFEIESSVITPGKVFEASGHVDHFREPMVECKNCQRRFRADHLLQETTGMSDTDTEKLTLKELMDKIKQRNVHCPECNGDFRKAKHFMTMFTTTIGPYSEATGYGRPEAAQGIFVEFRRLYEYARENLPFGVFQIGHALRNEISPRQGLIRLREFTIMDVEFFFDPEEPNCPLLKDVENETLRLLTAATKLKGKKEIIEVTVTEALNQEHIKAEWQAFFMVLSKRFLMELGVPEDKQRFIEKLDWERAHYSIQGFDQEIYLERWGWVEVSGHNYRTDFDLRRHMESSGVDMTVFKEYEKPVWKEEITIQPVMSKIGPDFKGKASEIVELLSNADPKKVEAALKRKGFYLLKEFKILPEHVKTMCKKVKKQGKRFIPQVIEPSFGSDRLVYIALEYAYRKKRGRTLLNLPRDLVPIQMSVYPLVSKDRLPEKAKQVYQMLMDEGFITKYDESGAIGRRYARADEIGIPLGVTVDYQTLKDDTVTVRDRDTWKQVRTTIRKLPELLGAYFKYQIDFDGLGQPING